MKKFKVLLIRKQLFYKLSLILHNLSIVCRTPLGASRMEPGALRMFLGVFRRLLGASKMPQGVSGSSVGASRMPHRIFRLPFGATTMPLRASSIHQLWWSIFCLFFDGIWKIIHDSESTCKDLCNKANPSFLTECIQRIYANQCYPITLTIWMPFVIMCIPRCGSRGNWITPGSFKDIWLALCGRYITHVRVVNIEKATSVITKLVCGLCIYRISSFYDIEKFVSINL